MDVGFSCELSRKPGRSGIDLDSSCEDVIMILWVEGEIFSTA